MSTNDPKIHQQVQQDAGNGSEQGVAAAKPQQLLLLMSPNLTTNNSPFVFIPPTPVMPLKVEEPPPFRKPYFRSVKGYLSNKEGMGSICRTCYRAIFNQNYIKLYDSSNEETCQELRHMLNRVVPSVDLEVYDDPIMCIKCVLMLFDSYAFQTKCLETEEKFKEWVSQRKDVKNDEVNLILLVETSTDDDLLEESIKNENVEISNVNMKEEVCGAVGSERQGSVQVCVNSIVQDHDYAYSPKKKSKKDVFLCEVCGYFVKTHEVFASHSQFHANADACNEMSLKCSKCNFLANNATILKKHYHVHNPPIYDCKACNEKFKTSQALQIHAKNMHFGLGDSFQCHICGKTFDYQASFTGHLVSHNLNQFVCEKCGKKFSDNRLFSNHLTSHNVENFVCELCNKSFKLRRNLEKHVESIHDNTTYKCNFCSKSYTKNEDLSKHKATVHCPKCEICQLRFSSRRKYDRHMVNLHEVKPYKCTICGRTFQTSHSAKMHVVIFHANKDALRCQFCAKKFRKEENLRDHEVAVHSELLKSDLNFSPVENQDLQIETVDADSEMLCPKVDIELNHVPLEDAAQTVTSDESQIEFDYFAMNEETVLVQDLF